MSRLKCVNTIAEYEPYLAESSHKAKGVESYIDRLLRRSLDSTRVPFGLDERSAQSAIQGHAVSMAATGAPSSSTVPDPHPGTGAHAGGQVGEGPNGKNQLDGGRTALTTPHHLNVLM